MGKKCNLLFVSFPCPPTQKLSVIIPLLILCRGIFPVVCGLGFYIFEHCSTCSTSLFLKIKVIPETGQACPVKRGGSSFFFPRGNTSAPSPQKNPNKQTKQAELLRKQCIVQLMSKPNFFFIINCLIVTQIYFMFP